VTPVITSIIDCLVPRSAPVPAPHHLRMWELPYHLPLLHIVLYKNYNLIVIISHTKTRQVSILTLIELQYFLRHRIKHYLIFLRE